MNINITTDKLKFIGLLMVEVLHEKKAVELIGTTADDFQNQIDWILQTLKDKDLKSYQSLLQSLKHLKKIQGVQ